MSKFLGKIFGEHGAKNVITVFHKPNVAASTRVLNLLKQANASAESTATEDQASSHDSQNEAERTPFTLDVTEAPPTPDQLKSILEYLGPQNVGAVVREAKTESDALAKLRANSENFERPLVVDWNAGKAVAGANESEILRLVRELRK